MNPKEKAIELVDKYILQTDCLSEAKELALKEANKHTDIALNHLESDFL